LPLARVAPYVVCGFGTRRGTVDDAAVAQAERAAVPRAHDAAFATDADTFALGQRTAGVRATPGDSGSEFLRHDDLVAVEPHDVAGLTIRRHGRRERIRPLRGWCDVDGPICAVGAAIREVSAEE